MKASLLLLAILLILIAFVIYRSSHPASQLNVEPHAGKEIEKAKRR